MGSGKTKTLLSDTLVFAIGNFAVKGIQFVLLPLYTASMTASEYGVAELLNNANELLFPVVCLGLYEALFRFSLDDDVPREKMVTGAVAVWAAGILFRRFWPLP